MSQFYPVKVEIEGKTYEGHWQLRQGGKLCVGWLYGSKVVELGTARPETVARRELPKLIKAWHVRREREARWIERETQRVARTGRARRRRKAET